MVGQEQKWFVQLKLHEEISLSHFHIPRSKFLRNALHSLSCALFFCTSAQPLAVAHPLLQLQDGDTFEQVGSAFPIDPVPSNIAYLKNVQSSELVIVQSNLMLCLGER